MKPFRSWRRSFTVAPLSLLFLLLFLFLPLALSGQEAMTSDAEETPMTTSESPSVPEETVVEETSPGPSKKGKEAAAEARVPLLPRWLRWIWESGDERRVQGEQVKEGRQPNAEELQEEADFQLAQATVAALALLIAFLTVAQLWQVPPPSTSLTDPTRTARAPAAAKTQAASEAAPAVPVVRTATNLFDSNFSRTVLSGLGGLAVVSMADKLWDQADLYPEPYYFILFVAFFLLGLVATALLRGVGEALRSRITLNRPAVIWPPVPWWPNSKEKKDTMPRSYRALQWLRYWGRRFWYWIASFRATVLVFLDTTFNVLIGKNQLQSAVFSETITDLHEGLLQAAERVRDEVHRAVIGALIRRGALPPDLPHEEKVRVAVSLLSSDETEVYYIAWERGSSPKRFGKQSLAWLSAFTGEARWMKLDPPGTSEDKRVWDLIYRKNPRAIAIDNSKNLISSHPRTELTVEQFFETRSGEDYRGFIVLPMPWTHRGVAGEHRKGAIHISFREAEYMEELWDGLELKKDQGEKPAGKTERIPNYESWKGLLQISFCEAWPVPSALVVRAERLRLRKSPPAETQTLIQEAREQEEQFQKLYDKFRPLDEKVQKHEVEKDTEGNRITIKDSVLCAVLHQSLEVLGEALAHFDDDVYDVYVRARQHPSMAPR